MVVTPKGSVITATSFTPQPCNPSPVLYTSFIYLFSNDKFASAFLGGNKGKVLNYIKTLVFETWRVNFLPINQNWLYSSELENQSERFTFVGEGWGWKGWPGMQGKEGCWFRRPDPRLLHTHPLPQFSLLFSSKDLFPILPVDKRPK